MSCIAVLPTFPRIWHMHNILSVVDLLCLNPHWSSELFCLSMELTARTEEYIHFFLYTGVSFIVSLGMVALLHTMPASTRTYCDSCYAQGQGRRDTLQSITVMFLNNFYSKFYQHFYRGTIKSPSTTHYLQMEHSKIKIYGKLLHIQNYYLNCHLTASKVTCQLFRNTEPWMSLWNWKQYRA